jgi:hypothetical protein
MWLSAFIRFFEDLYNYRMTVNMSSRSSPQTTVFKTSSDANQPLIFQPKENKEDRLSNWHVLCISFK